MKTNLQVPFAEKDEAKRLGARWDAANKVWYIKDQQDLTPFLRWLPNPARSALAAKAPLASKAASVAQKSSGLMVVGSAYVVPTRLCDCLPWDVCPKCESTALR